MLCLRLPPPYEQLRRGSRRLFYKKYDLSSLKTQYLAGERCDIVTLEWYTKHIPIPAIDHWWQTESGWPMIATMMGVEIFPIKPGSVGKAVCGYNIKYLMKKELS
jgi:propionyl-CoA synthetase